MLFTKSTKIAPRRCSFTHTLLLKLLLKSKVQCTAQHLKMFLLLCEIDLLQSGIVVMDVQLRSRETSVCSKNLGFFSDGSGQP